MFKRMLASLCLYALLNLPVGALAGDFTAHIVRTPEQGKTASLRSKPSGGGSLVGRYFSGVEVFPLEDAKSGWIKVRVGDSAASVTGYMSTASLVTDPNEPPVASAIPLYTAIFSSWELRAAPDNESEILATFGFDEVVELLGVCRNWWQVRCNGRIGFVPAGSESVLEEALAVIHTDAPEGTVPLLALPEVEATSLGSYHCGTLVRMLPGKAGEWAKVNVRGVVGYLPLINLSIGVHPDTDAPALPTLNVPANCPLWDRPDASSIQRAGPAQESAATLIGELEGWYHVRLGNAYGFIEASAVQ